MTKKEKEQLEPVLAPLRSLIGREDFKELALVYLQRDKDYVIFGIEKESTGDCLCLLCYDNSIRPMADGLVIITSKEEPVDLKKLLRSHPSCCWCHYLTYDDVDEILFWIQRDGEDLREKYKNLTETVQETLSFLNGRNYGWWESGEEGEG